MYAIILFHYLGLLRTWNRSTRIISWFPSFYCVDTFLFQVFLNLINFSPVTYFFFCCTSNHTCHFSAFFHTYVLSVICDLVAKASGLFWVLIHFSSLIHLILLPFLSPLKLSSLHDSLSFCPPTLVISFWPIFSNPR